MKKMIDKDVLLHYNIIGKTLLYVNENEKVCQEQIELSGFVANELSAFTVLEWRAI